MEDLLGAEIGKNDYDWLLTPPGTPRTPRLEVAEKTPSSNILPRRTATRSSSTTRASRLSVSQTENGLSTVPARPARSNSVTRPSIQSTLMSSSNRTAVLNTSISSVSSRPTTPSRRSSTVVPPKQSVAASRPVPARYSTPVKTRPSTPAKTRPSTPVRTRQAANSTSDSTAAKITSAQNSRPSTPTSRSRAMPNSSSGAIPAMSRPGVIPATSRGTVSATSRPGSSSSNVPGISRATSLSSSTIPSMSRSTSRSSTPTRQPAIRSSAPNIGRSPSVGRSSSISSLTSSINRPAANGGRNSAPSSAPSSRPGSPSPRPRAPVRPLDIPDFPNETPPNLRTKLPERPLSAGRSRPGMALGVRSTPSNESSAASAPVKKVSVPAMSRSKFSDAPSKTPTLTNGRQNRQTERSSMDSQPTKGSRPVTGTDNGFGMTMSKKSLDMAIRHMDIRQNLGGIRGAALFPHSIRSTAGKGRPARMSDPGHTISNGDRHYGDNGSINGHFSGDSNGALSRNGGSSTDSPDRGSIGGKETLSELDMYGSSRYEAMLLREDVRNTSWLHGFDDAKPDQSPLFDHRFEPLPEPFSPL
ncbi:mucin-5AC-like isoform X3 [Oryza brachyantha]|uniref:Proline-rich family protein n=1 Tax=Oryza brachyantha TaxID=4533 RepID=J3M871_ORYBR|nr:mucin-5AC-like isoform X2 [Oryza brachyantha]XP_040380155.1 mucin-5AC-like isoform X3 [Oryza brachyantha]